MPHPSLVEKLRQHYPTRVDKGGCRIEVCTNGHWHPIRRQSSGHWQGVFYAADDRAVVDQLTGIFAEFDTQLHVPNTPRPGSSRHA